MSRILPILFNTDMVQAILDGRKTVTRRLVMPHNRKKAKEQGYCQGNGLWVDPGTDNGDKEGHIKDYSISPCWMSYRWYIDRYAPYKPEDVLYVRETWAFATCINCNREYIRKGAPANCYDYQAVEYDDGDSISEGCFIYRADCENPERITWRPSIHMPKQAARIWLKVTDVRVERLQDISLDDCRREGIDISRSGIYTRFSMLWNSTIKKPDYNLYSWDANPWVWVIEFEQCGKPESAI